MEFQDKQAARAGLATALRQTSAEQRAAWSAEVRRALEEAEWWRAARTVMLFAALKYEPDLLALLDNKDGKRFVFPNMMNDRIVPREAGTAEALSISAGGIREPSGGRLVPPEEVDLVLVPGLGFSRSGVRLGRGRGHYDFFLPSLRPGVPRVGVCFDLQLRDSLPTEPHDVRMDAVVTQSGLIPAAK